MTRFLGRVILNIYEIQHRKTLQMLRLRVFDPPRLAPYHLLVSFFRKSTIRIPKQGLRTLWLQYPDTASAPTGRPPRDIPQFLTAFPSIRVEDKSWRFCPPTLASSEKCVQALDSQDAPLSASHVDNVLQPCSRQPQEDRANNQL